MHWHRGLNHVWPHKFGFKPLLGFEPIAPIRPQLLVSHDNHSATETSMYVCSTIYVCIMYVCVYMCVRAYMRVCMHVCVRAHAFCFNFTTSMCMCWL